MKKLIFLAVLLICLCSLSQRGATGEELILNLEEGILGPFKLGSSYEIFLAKEILGEPETTPVLFAFVDQFCDKGIEIWSDYRDICEIGIYFKDALLDGKFFKAFQGTITPRIAKDANKDNIKRMFGSPWHKDIETMTYYRPYGQLTFGFDKDGYLERIGIMVLE